MHHPRGASAERSQGGRVLGQEFAGEDSHELIVRPGGVQEWAEQIKDGRDALCSEELPHGGDRLEGRVIGRRENKAEPIALYGFPQAFWGEIDPYAKRLEHVRATTLRGDRAVA